MHHISRPSRAGTMKGHDTMLAAKPTHSNQSLTNQIVVSDAIALMNDIPAGSADLLLTDIPYAHVSRPSGGLRVLDKGFADAETFDLLEFAGASLRATGGNGVVFCGKEQFSHCSTTSRCRKYRCG